MPPTDEQGAAGALPIGIGSETKFVPVLPMAYADNWIAGLWKALLDMADSASEGTSPDTEQGQHQLLARINSLANERALDLVVAFDRKGALGTRRELLETASPRQLRTALEAMKEECLPFAAEMTFMVMASEVVRSRLQPSTNGHSPNGTSPSTTSANGSRTASSGSSGKPARNASRVKAASG